MGLSKGEVDAYVDKHCSKMTTLVKAILNNSKARGFKVCCVVLLCVVAVMLCMHCCCLFEGVNLRGVMQDATCLASHLSHRVSAVTARGKATKQTCGYHTCRLSSKLLRAVVCLFLHPA